MDYHLCCSYSTLRLESPSNRRQKATVYFPECFAWVSPALFQQIELSLSRLTCTRYTANIAAAQRDVEVADADDAALLCQIVLPLFSTFVCLFPRMAGRCIRSKVKRLLVKQHVLETLSRGGAASRFQSLP